MISAYAIIGGKRHHLGTEAVLSRWHVAGCANCQTHLEAKAIIGVPRVREEAVGSGHFEVEVRTRDGLLGQPRALAMAGTAATAARRPFRFEVR
jgi:tyrosinase